MCTYIYVQINICIHTYVYIYTYVRIAGSPMAPPMCSLSSSSPCFGLETSCPQVHQGMSWIIIKGPKDPNTGSLAFLYSESCLWFSGDAFYMGAWTVRV